jgi:hypothetical protein
MQKRRHQEIVALDEPDLPREPVGGTRHGLGV